MTKNDLVAAVARRTGMTKQDAGKAIEAAFSTITETLRGGEEVRILGFGTFAPHDRPAISGRHPKTGAAIQIAASRQVKFKAGQGLRDTLNV